MATIRLPPDWKDFLRLLDFNQVQYLLIGGYAVGYHGYPRVTADMDIWIATSAENALRIVSAIREFGFDDPEIIPELFTEQKKIIRMGVPPIRIKVISEVDGVEFGECYMNRVLGEIDGVQLNIIDLENLKKNKKASGRLKDLADLEHLP